MTEKIVRRPPVPTRPVDDSFKITQPFGYDNTDHPTRHHFYTLFDNRHPGVDFDMPIGSEVRASFEGVVVRREFHKGMGNVVGIRNGNIVALYAHLDKFGVDFGEVVRVGQKLGLSGNTGVAKDTYPHLHFELRDISKTAVKDMVFEPRFGIPISQWHDHFVYLVDNTNTQKDLEVLAIRYFGNRNCIPRIKDINPNLSHFSENELLIQDTQVVIPNFQ